MNTLRHSTMLTLALLAWFASSLVFSTLNTMTQPPVGMMDMTVCIGSGGVMTSHMPVDDEGSPATDHHGPKCPLCFSVLPPTASLDAPLHHPQPLGRALQPIVAAHIKAITGAPYPPRGPPALA